METRSLSGWIMFFVGVLFFIFLNEAFILGLILIVVGLFIALNKAEDVIEEIELKNLRKNKISKGVKKRGKK